MPVKGPEIGAVAIGAVFVYGGIKGYSILKAMQNIVQGKPAGEGQQTALLASGGGGGSANGQAIADAAKAQIGSKYVYGGVPGKDGKGGWDCSSFVNWILGVKMGLPIPGMAHYDGTSHGPVASAYANYGSPVNGGPSAAQPGDIIVWPTHVGIAIGPDRMVSAYTTQKGVIETSITGGGPHNEKLIGIRRP